MKLAFFSGGDDELNLRANLRFKAYLKTSRPLITFIPNCLYFANLDFKEFVEMYRPLFPKAKFILFSIDIPFDKVLLERVMESDWIHMGGGNTFYFLNSLRHSRLGPKLKKFVKEGKVLSGLSAGAISMTPNIEMAGRPSFDCDENDVGLTNLKAMGLTRYEFFPHYKNSIRYDQSLLEYTLENESTVYAVSDGGAIFQGLESFEALGKCYLFCKGFKTRVA